MVHTVDLPNGEIAQFPDEMHPEQIQAVIQKQFPPKVNTMLGEMDKPNLKQMMTDPGTIDQMMRGFALAPQGRMVEGVHNAMNAFPEFAFGKPMMEHLQGVNKIAQKIPVIGEAINGLISQTPRFKSVINAMEKPAVGAMTGAAAMPENPLMGAALGGAAPVVGNAVSNVWNKLNPGKVFNSSTHKDLAKEVQNAHDKLYNASTDIFNNVEKEAEKRGINIIPIAKNVINKVKEFLPDTRKTTRLLEDAKDGDYKDLRKLQTELWHRGTSHLSSKLPSEQKTGEVIMDLRDRINESIGEHFEKNGHTDLNKMLDEANILFANMKKTFFGKKVPPSIKNLVHEDTRKIPKNIHNVMQEESIPMDRIRASNPLIEKHIKSLTEKENVLNRLKFLGKTGAIGGAAGATVLGAPTLINKASSVFSE